ncbi:SPOR domain-containing protein [Roseicyclus persicicus]|uniref:SPOR domain-containing protein n=1 Tax=Roseicyclus persicicus TaxID=2650661 RepID=A0A7X6JYS4_9RHOB|nr:SPOR domain-containing protein [Roseibacterium persicicum]NKX44425.1 SPOR domain-containing protein [Roseibacterium persicicum]
MTRFHPIPSRARLGLALCALLALAACGEDFRPFGDAGTRNATGDGPAPIGATRLVERDVEAPEVFQVTEEGLWDGRPSLGGVWVAHPTADDPERVLIRNEENGRFVIGALFRRERDHPGPELMVSSDAAAALNILAGDPTLLQVTALRREEVSDPVIEPAEGAEALPAAAEGTEVATPAITATPLGDPIAAAEAAITQSEIAAATAAAPARPLPAAATASAAPAAPSATPAPTPVAAAPAAAASALDRPFIQIGIFSVQENANNTGQALRNAGLVPTIYDQSSNGRRFWRVVVGPAQTSADRDAILATVRGLGFEDAYFVTR